MPVSVYPECNSLWFEMTKPGGMPLLSIWDDGSAVLESGVDNTEFIYPTLEEWEFLAQIVATNIKRLKKENSGS